MNATVAVALITALSTLAGAGISGLITLRISRTNSNDQLISTNAERLERRLVGQRRVRRDCYVQFLNQLATAEVSLTNAWRTNSSGNPSLITDILKAVTPELDALSISANLVILEGPPEVSLAAQVLQARLTLESVDVINAAKQSPGIAPCLVDDQRYIDLQMERAKLKSAFIKAARNALDMEKSELDHPVLSANSSGRAMTADGKGLGTRTTET
jgi:hypothetical protein